MRDSLFSRPRPGFFCLAFWPSSFPAQLLAPSPLAHLLPLDSSATDPAENKTGKIYATRPVIGAL